MNFPEWLYSQWTLGMFCNYLFVVICIAIFIRLVAKYCQEIQAPFFGKIDCEGFTVGKKCSFSCNEGYHIDNDVIRVCQSHGKWSNNQPKCVRKSSNFLLDIAHYHVLTVIMVSFAINFAADYVKLSCLSRMFCRLIIASLKDHKRPNVVMIIPITYQQSRYHQNRVRT